ncbi:hypothetical protein FM112_10015 [Gulosibacter sp. 10]|nr:hypothetical protein FM112_10015 [Gulosibacter sp. 10]
MAIILGAILFFGNLMAIYAVRAAIDGRITPHTMAGIRTNATRANAETWEVAHRAARPWAFTLNGLGAVAALGVMALGSTVGPFLTAASCSVVFTLAGAISQLIVGHRAAARVLGR